MRKAKILFVLLILAAGLVGCASPNMKLSDPAEPYIVPDANKAMVYFIRPIKLGWAINAAVYDNNNFVGFVPYGQKLPYQTEPGEHMFMVVSEAADFLKADLLPGKTYYVQVIPRMGAWRARFSLAPITKDDLKNARVQHWINSAKLIKNKDSAYTWAENNNASVMHKKEAYLPKWQGKPDDKKPYLGTEDCE